MNDNCFIRIGNEVVSFRSIEVINVNRKSIIIKTLYKEHYFSLSELNKNIDNYYTKEENRKMAKDYLIFELKRLIDLWIETINKKNDTLYEFGLSSVFCVWDALNNAKKMIVESID